MKRLTRYLSIAYAVTLVVVFVVLTLHEALASVTLPEVLAAIKQLPLIGKVFIGLGIWIVSVIVPYIIYKHLVKPPVEGPGVLWLFFFTLIWPPAWPIALIVVVVWVVLKMTSR